MAGLGLQWLLVSFCLRCRRRGFSPWVRKIPWGRNGNPLKYSCLENPVDRGAWWATVHGVSESRTGLRLTLSHFDLCIGWGDGGEQCSLDSGYLTRGGDRETPDIPPQIPNVKEFPEHHKLLCFYFPFYVCIRIMYDENLCLRQKELLREV